MSSFVVVVFLLFAQGCKFTFLVGEISYMRIINQSEKVRLRTYLGLGYHQTLLLKLTQVLAVNIA